MTEISKNRADFTRYVKDNENRKIRFTVIDFSNLETITVEKPYMHRFRKEYINSVLARFYKLDEWMNCKDKTDMTFITFTTRQRGLTYPEQFNLLKESFRSLRDVMRRDLKKDDKTFNYFWVAEPHKSGYAHIHMLAFVKINKDLQHKYKLIWSDKYNAGNYENGLEFNINETDRSSIDFDKAFTDKNNKTGRGLHSAKNYMMKYLRKSLNNMENLSAGQLDFWSTAWSMSRDENFKGFRFWGSSKELTTVMKLDYEQEENIKCSKVEILGDDTNTEVYYNSQLDELT